MDDTQIGWLTAILIGGVAGWLAEIVTRSNMGILTNVVLGRSQLVQIVGHVAKLLENGRVSETAQARVACAHERKCASIRWIAGHDFGFTICLGRALAFLRLTGGCPVFSSHKRQCDIVGHGHLQAHFLLHHHGNEPKQDREHASDNEQTDHGSTGLLRLSARVACGDFGFELVDTSFQKCIRNERDAQRLDRVTAADVERLPNFTLQFIEWRKNQSSFGHMGLS